MRSNIIDTTNKVLTYIFACSGFVFPGMATPSYTSNTFPSDELMQADYTYVNQAIYDNTGVYSDSVSANPIYINETYNCGAGYYLTKNTETCTQCPRDNYCPGGTYSFNEISDQGINHCPGDLHAPMGMQRATQCGRRMNFTLDGGLYVYMHGEKKTDVAVNIDMDMDGVPDFFGNMTPVRVPMNIDFADKTNHNKWVVEIYKDFVNSAGKTIPAGTYYVYDDTINPDDYIASSLQSNDGE